MECTSSLKISQQMEKYFNSGGFETHPFLIKWYNQHVAEEFKLDYDEHTLAFVITSTPSMFEKAFKAYILKETLDMQRDPIDECISNFFGEVKEKFTNSQIECIFDYERYHNRRPKVLVQTAGHVAGAAFFYQRHHITNDPWDKKKVCGVSIHPKYGGWFGLRGVMIFTNIHDPDLVKREPLDVVTCEEKRIELLEKFNYHWQDWSFRDIIPVGEKYSADQMAYFGTLPKNRGDLIESLKAGKPLLSGDMDKNKFQDSGHSFVDQ